MTILASKDGSPKWDLFAGSDWFQTFFISTGRPGQSFKEKNERGAAGIGGGAIRCFSMFHPSVSVVGLGAKWDVCFHLWYLDVWKEHPNASNNIVSWWNTSRWFLNLGMLSAKKTLKHCGSWNLPHVEKYRLWQRRKILGNEFRIGKPKNCGVKGEKEEGRKHKINIEKLHVRHSCCVPVSKRFRLVSGHSALSVC